LTDPGPTVAAGTGVRTRRTVLVTGLILVAALLLLLFMWLRDDGSDTYQRWREGTVHGRWRTVFDGEGSAGGQGESVLLRPRPPMAATETHAGLVVTRDFYHDVDYHVELRTTARLRRPAPNPWEVAWVVWSYTDEHHFYYLTLKSNGWELGKRDPAYPGGQRFLATGRPVFPPGPWYQVSIAQRGATITAQVGGRRLTTLTDNERPYPTGAAGCYAEDAGAEFRSFSIRST
jgi:hypothetical protein